MRGVRFLISSQFYNKSDFLPFGPVWEKHFHCSILHLFCSIRPLWNQFSRQCSTSNENFPHSCRGWLTVMWKRLVKRLTLWERSNVWRNAARVCSVRFKKETLASETCASKHVFFSYFFFFTSLLFTCQASPRFAPNGTQGRHLYLNISLILSVFFFPLVARSSWLSMQTFHPETPPHPFVV